MDDEYKIHKKKRNDRIYVSRVIEHRNVGTTDIRKIRIVSKVLDSSENHLFAKINDELIIRVTDQKRQEIIAKFYEDTKGVFRLIFQKFTTETGMPHKSSFTFVGNEIPKILNFIKKISKLRFINDNKFQVEDPDDEEIPISDEQAKKFVKTEIKKYIDDKNEVLIELLKNDVTFSDIVTLTYRKEQLEHFKNLLYDKIYFDKHKESDGDEKVWQKFFEKNTWIFGYGLSFIVNSPLDEKKMEQIVSGYNFNTSGKKVDILMKTIGMINSLCFAEIKTSTTSLLKKLSNPYRKECWQISDELSGGIAQIQKTVQKAIKDISTKTEIKDKFTGDLTGEDLFLYKPKSFLIIGNLNEFIINDKINEDKFSSFELFRQSIHSPEIITFDELYERTKFIVEYFQDL